MTPILRRLLPSSRRQWTIFLAVFTIVLIYVLIASYKISFPGVNYDESLYLNAALGGIDKTTFLTNTFHGFPILLMPYIGALKAYIFFPIFKLFGVSSVTMRLPDILLSGGGLAVLYFLLREQIGRFMSLCVLALTALDASFIMFTRLDNGPVVLDFLLKIIGLFALLKFAGKHQRWALYVFWIAMFLGVFNKLNFIWYVNAFVAGYVLVYGRSLWLKLRRSEFWKLLTISIVGYLLVIAYYAYINFTYHLGTSFGFVGWHLIYSIFDPLVSGTWFYNYTPSVNNLAANINFWFMSGVVVCGIVVRFWRVHHPSPTINKRLSNFYNLAVLVLLFILVQLAFTKQALAGWHYFSIYPFYEIVFLLSGWFLLEQLLGKKNVKLVRIIILVFTCLLCLYQLNVYRQYADDFKNPPTYVIWSPAIYSLINYAKSQPNSQFISLDWGTQTQLMGFNPVKNKYFEVIGPISTVSPVQSQAFFTNFVATKPNAFYVAYVHPGNGTPAYVQEFLEIVKQHGDHPRIVKTFSFDNQPIYEVYRLK